MSVYVYFFLLCFFFFKQKTAYELRISDWSADVFSSDLRVLADREVAAMADVVVGANEPGFHLAGVNWGRDLPEPDTVADIRSVVEGDRAADGGELRIVRGIEVGHVFQLGSKYAEAMGCTVLDEQGKPRVLQMGCYGIGI